MDDEKIIQQGGGDREINQYAEMNGADLTMSHTNKWEEKVRKEISEHPAIKHVTGIETMSAIRSGNLNSYQGETIPDMIIRLLTTQKVEMCRSVQDLPQATFASPSRSRDQFVERDRVLDIIKNN